MAGSEPRLNSLTEAQVRAIRERMRKPESPRDGVCRRSHAKVAFHREDILMQILKPGGQSSEIVVASQNISPGGICLLHSRFLHAGTPCRLTIRRRDGFTENCNGTVVWCRLIAGTGHAMGVKFATPIRVADFVGPPQGKNAPPPPPPVAKLKGRVLLVDPSESDRLLFNFHLSSQAIELTTVAAAAEAASLVAAAPPDVVMCELNLPDDRGEDLIGRLRASGYLGYVAALTAETDPTRLAAVREAGGNDILAKPYTGEMLTSCLTAALRAASRQPIHSSILSKVGAGPLVAQYVDHVRKVAAALRDAIAADNLKNVRTLCLNLKGTGAGYGFASLSEAAHAAAVRLDGSTSIPRASAELAILQSVCHRLSAEKAA